MAPQKDSHLHFFVVIVRGSVTCEGLSILAGSQRLLERPRALQRLLRVR